MLGRSTIAVAAACALMLGCSHRTRTDLPMRAEGELSPTVTSRLPAMRTDDAIESEVERKFAAEGRINDVSIEVTASQGVVTLTGHVVAERQRRRFETLAQSVEGVEQVQNRLVVARASKPAPVKRDAGPGPIPEIMPGSE